MKIISLLWNEVIFYRTVGLKVSNQFIMSYQQRIGLLLFQGEIREAKWSEFDFKNFRDENEKARKMKEVLLDPTLFQLKISGNT